MPLAKRILLAGLGLATVHGVLAVLGLVVLGGGRLALFFGLCAVLTTALTIIARPLLEPPVGGDGGAGVEGGPGGDGPRGPGPDRDPDAGVPPWWPDFERDFWSHVERAPGDGAPADRTPA